MKIAICYSGFLRNIDSTITSIRENLVGEHDVDFYFHTWRKPEYENEFRFAMQELTPIAYLKEDPKLFELNPYNFINSEIIPEEYKTQLKISDENKIFFEPPSPENDFTFYKNKEVVKFKYYSSFPYNFLSQFYSTFSSNFLRKSTRKRYHAVIRLRSDLEFTQKIDLTSFDLNVVNVINSPGHFGQISVNDHFAVASPEIMNIYADLFLYIPVYYFVYKIDMIQEIYLANHLKLHGIDVVKHTISNRIRRDTISREYTSNFVR